MTQEEYVVLVDEVGQVLGTAEKMLAHEEGLLHKAFSIFIFNDEGKMLLQQRALTKYHFGGLWSNSCCSHPRLNESDADAAHRRLEEELGFDTDIKQVFTFLYRAEDTKTALIEHELDVVFVGFYNEEFDFNKEEVADIKWVSVAELYQELNFNPDHFTYWFKTALLELKNRDLLSLSALKELMGKE